MPAKTPFPPLVDASASPALSGVASPPRVTVVIPTSCRSSRSRLLLGAVQSVAAQRGVAFDLLVVANGPDVDPDVLTAVSEIPQVGIVRLAQGNVSFARLAGMMTSSSDYFCFLDDDDELLPDALRKRVAYLDQHPEADFLVTDGIVRGANVVRRSFRDGMVEAIRADPEAAFLLRNWFHSPSPTFRRRTIGSELFSSGLRHFEWTWLLLNLLTQNKRVAVLGEETFVKREDLSDSVSKSEEYLLAMPSFLQKAKRLPLSAQMRHGIQRKLAAACHACAEHYLRKDELANALRWHVVSLRAGGWRYTTFFGHIVTATLRRGRK